MLGDFSHESPLPFHNVTTVLSIWLNGLKNGESNVNHLTLFLEDDRIVVELVNQFLKSGDLAPLLDFTLPSATLERLEFYSDLRRITIQIDSLNSGLSPSNQIQLEIQGPEEMNVFDPRILDSSDRAATRYFVAQRDSLSAKNIITYLNQHPDYKGLIFYGLLHLVTQVTAKDNSGDVTPEESTGKFLANYLEGKFGDDQVFVVNQLARGSYPDNSVNLGRSILVKSEDVPWKNSSPHNITLVPQNFDAFVLRGEFVVPGHPLSQVFSKRILRASIKRLEFLDSHRSSAFGKRFYDQALKALTFLSDTVLPGVAAWKAWYHTSSIELLKKLRSANYRDQLAIDWFRRRHDPETINDLIGLGFDIRIRNSQITREDWADLFKEEWPQVLFLNAIGIYWIGDQSEQEVAKAFLLEATGKSFDAPDKYLKFWREKFFHVSY